MKKPIRRAGAKYKKASGALSAATLDRAENAVTYRVYGCENARAEGYENALNTYEKTAVRAGVQQSALPPLYLAAANAEVIFILWFGAKNVLGIGWRAWDIAAFTTFLSCFTKLTLRSSKVAKLFNSVQKAEVSWKRIRPLMKLPEPLPPLEVPSPADVTIEDLSFSYGEKPIFSGLSLTAHVGGIIGMAADACRILSIFAVIAVKNTGLALVLLAVLPFFALFTRRVQKRMLAAQLDNRRAVAVASGQVPETLHNIRTVHALGAEDYMERRYDKRIGESYAAVEKTNFYDAIYSPMVLLLNAAVVGVVMLLSASANAQILALFGMSVGTSVAVINYISRIFSPIESLGMEIQTIQSAMAGVRRIDAFLAQSERTVPPVRASAVRGDIVFSHVTFGYGESPVLRDFSLTVREGEQVTLVGRTGAGKSTVFRLLLGLYRPSVGRITVGGVDVSEISDGERRACIGCVEQHFSRVPGTVADQITLGDPSVTEEMMRNAAKLSGIDEAILSLPDGYATVCTDGMFSQGEWQLLSIARAAAADPAILLLDEITANLDAETEARVLLALRRASEGRTVLSISHRIYEDLGGRRVEIRSHASETDEASRDDLRQTESAK